MNCNKVIDHLYIGNSKCISDKQWLRDTSITHIINCTFEIPDYFPNDFHYLKLGLNDNNEDIFGILEPSYNYIDKVIKRGGNVIVHCHMGISRSASVVIYYLMRKHGLSFDKARNFLRSKRSIINPNEYYTRQLRDADIIMHKK